VKAAERTKRMDQKLKELELNGLVDFRPGEEAKFVVLGSTGNHYTITLTDDKQTCQCIDHRIRYVRDLLTTLRDGLPVCACPCSLHFCCGPNTVLCCILHGPKPE
jgi:hypothetical protein